MKEITHTPPAHLLVDTRVEGAKAKNVMGKDDFMKLLVTQLQHQDPLKPMDHQEFATQLAQFGSLEQLTNIGTAINGLKSGFGEEAKLQAIGMIGKHVSATGDELELVEGKGATIKHSLPPDTKPIKASILDMQGKSVREIDLSSRPLGSKKDIEWDGKDREGTPLPSGKYLFRVLGVSKEGKSQEVGTEISGRVTGVEIAGQKPLLIVETGSGKKQVDLAKVRQVEVEDPKAKDLSKIDLKDGTLPHLAGSDPVVGESGEVSEESDTESVDGGRNRLYAMESFIR